MNKVHSYNAHETQRMLEIHGIQLASFKARLAAFMIDFLLAFVVFLIVIFSINGFGMFEQFGIKEDTVLKFDLSNWYSLVCIVLYFCLATYFGNGKTLGKLFLRIRVVSLVHERMSLWHSFERALGYGASALEGGFGFFQYFIHPNKRTVHDRIAETIVIKEGKKNS